MKSTIDKSKRYSYEANNLELLNTKLDDTKQALEKMNNTFPEVSKLVISDDSLVYLTKIIDEFYIKLISKGYNRFDTSSLIKLL